MKILFVLNSLYIKGNGLATSAQHTIQALKDAGQDVRVLAAANADPNGPQPEYPMQQIDVPIIQPMLSSFGYHFTEWKGPQVEAAVRWADVVHIEEAFYLQRSAIRWAHKLGKPITGTYHLHPENIFCNIGMKNWHLAHQIQINHWCRNCFDHCLYLQCPTEMVRQRMIRHHVKAECFTLSNGLMPTKCLRPLTPPADYLNENRPLKLLYVGRIAVEKDQPTLFKAIRYSKYAHRIQLQLAGRGPETENYTRMANKLYEDGVVKYKPQVGFYSHEELQQLAAKADLAVHCAFVEVEGLSIMEALQQAVTPVIAVAHLSGSSEYALDDRSKFPAQNPKALAEKIDYWFDHPEERWQMGFKYAELMKNYEIAASAKGLIEMFKKAVAK